MQEEEEVRQVLMAEKAAEEEYDALFKEHERLNERALQRLRQEEEEVSWKTMHSPLSRPPPPTNLASWRNRSPV